MDSDSNSEYSAGSNITSDEAIPFFRPISAATRPQPIYGAKVVISAIGWEVVRAVNILRARMGPRMNQTRIIILTGTHGRNDGTLGSPEDEFYQIDNLLSLQTVLVVRVHNQTPAHTWQRYFRQRNAIIILAWCYSALWNELTTYSDYLS